MKHVKIYVFSTCVEVILRLILLTEFTESILHVCGGDPLAVAILGVITVVFSRCVEVIL